MLEWIKRLTELLFNKETMVRLNSKTALANDGDFMAGIFDEFNGLKANKEPQKPNSFY